MKLPLQTLVVVIGLLSGATAFSQTTAPAVNASASMSGTPATSALGSKKGAAPAAKTTSPMAEAAGGGDGKVWVNTKSKTYHCAGTKYYGKTKAGEYMTEGDAKTRGSHADHGKACAK